MSQYHLDLSKFPLGWLRDKIESHEIVPARKMLQENIPERFARSASSRDRDRR
ncbi:MAG: hypothetical protein WBC63_07600 [Candidatus Bipolaricaulia bacterium]